MDLDPRMDTRVEDAGHEGRIKYGVTWLQPAFEIEQRGLKLRDGYSLQVAERRNQRRRKQLQGCNRKRTSENVIRCLVSGNVRSNHAEIPVAQIERERTGAADGSRRSACFIPVVPGPCFSAGGNWL